jgi:hypothetical protein
MTEIDLGYCKGCGDSFNLSIEDTYDRLSDNQCFELAEMLLEDGFIEQDYPIKEIVNEDFSANLDALKGIYYRLTNKEEDMLTKLFKKYL